MVEKLVTPPRIFLCSRMKPRGMESIRAELKDLLGSNGTHGTHRQLFVEYLDATGDDGDARPPCARSLRECDGVVIILDGGSSTPRTPFESTTLEMEVMLAAVNGKPIWVVDASDGSDPLYDVLKSDFFDKRDDSSVIKVSPSVAGKDRIKLVIEHVYAICQGGYREGEALNSGVGWQNLYVARRDSSAFRADSDARYFPFGNVGLNLPSFDAEEIQMHLDLAETAYKTDQIVSLVHSWDAIRGLSKKPWRSSALDADSALLWLRALHFWGGSMSWLGLFGHCNAAAVMVNRSACDLVSRFDHAEMKPGGPFGLDKLLGGLASSYFSLARQAPDATIRAIVRAQGIDYCDKALSFANDPRSQAGLLAIRGALRLLAGAKGFAGLADLHMSEYKHSRAAKNNTHDGGLAAARVQVGAAYKEIGRRVPATVGITLNLAESYLRRAVDSLERGLMDDPNANGGQLIMGMKHLLEVKYLQGNRTEAFELWTKTRNMAKTMGLDDQLRQLTQIGVSWGWDDAVNATPKQGHQ